MTITSEYEHSTNGAAPPPTPAAGPRIPRREVWVDLTEAYPDFKVRLWINYPKRLLDELSSEDNERIKAALCQIVLEHNGWLDFDGQPFPPASDPSFWDQIPDELAGVVVVVTRLESGKLSTSLVPPTRRR